ncbi:hypothetical protein GCM10027341_12760 [Spirosoma knui]
MRKLLGLLVLWAALVSCSREDEPITPETLTGTWVEKSARRDTLIFNPVFQGQVLMGTLTVNRGKELNAGGYLLPKLGSGIYSYELRGDRIYVRNSLSSSSVGAEYKLAHRRNELLIENFFELGFNQPATTLRTLVRLP